jgi:hypothetical protein
LRFLSLAAVGVAVTSCSSPLRTANDVTSDAAVFSDSAARVLYEAYGAALRSHRRDELARFYHPEGATIVFDGVRRVSSLAEIDRRYRERWQGPVFFAFDSLRFEPLGPAHVTVTGGFRWVSQQSADTAKFIYLSILEKTSAGLRIRVEHETRLPPQ